VGEGVAHADSGKVDPLFQAPSLVDRECVVEMRLSLAQTTRATC